MRKDGTDELRQLSSLLALNFTVNLAPNAFQHEAGARSHCQKNKDEKIGKEKNEEKTGGWGGVSLQKSVKV